MTIVYRMGLAGVEEWTRVDGYLVCGEQKVKLKTSRLSDAACPEVTINMMRGAVLNHGRCLIGITSHLWVVQNAPLGRPLVQDLQMYDLDLASQVRLPS